MGLGTARFGNCPTALASARKRFWDAGLCHLAAAKIFRDWILRLCKMLQSKDLARATLHGYIGII